MDWSTFVADLERMNRVFKAKSTKGMADFDAHHKQLSQSAADIFAAIRDEAQLDVDHGNGTGDLIRRQARTIRDYLPSLDRLADALTSVEGDRQDAYDSTPTRNWYSRGARNMRDRKYNENHDPANGRFTSGPGGGGGGGTTTPEAARSKLDKLKDDFRTIDLATEREHDDDSYTEAEVSKLLSDADNLSRDLHDLRDSLPDGAADVRRQVEQYLGMVRNREQHLVGQLRKLRNKSVPGAHGAYK